LALLHDRQGHTAQAIYIFDRLLAIDPDNAIAKSRLQKVLERVPDQALRHDIEVLQKNPDDEQAADQIGRAYQRLGKLDEAINFYYDVLARRPQDNVTRTNLGMALILNGRTADGIRELEDVLKADPKHDRALNMLAWMRAAHPFAMFRNGKEAVKFAEAAAANNRDNNAGILDTLAAAYAEAGQFDKAVETIKKAIKGAQQKRDPIALEFESRLKLYEAHKPYHDPLPPGVVDPSEAKPKTSAAPAAK
jgi:tetratricopeptide (TPR) repeat protein